MTGVEGFFLGTIAGAGGVLLGLSAWFWSDPRPIKPQRIGSPNSHGCVPQRHGPPRDYVPAAYREPIVWSSQVYGPPSASNPFGREIVGVPYFGEEPRVHDGPTPYETTQTEVGCHSSSDSGSGSDSGGCGGAE